MKVGMNLFLWTTDPCGEDLAPTFGLLRELGYDGVEIPIFDSQPEPARYAVLGRALDALGLARTAVTARTAAHSPISADEAIRRAGHEHLGRVLACAEALGASLLVGPLYAPLGYLTGARPSDDEWRRAVETVRAGAEEAARRGVTLALEPLNRFETHLINTAADGARFVNDVAHPHCRLMYDTFHAHIEEKSVGAALRSAAAHLVHVHAAECDRGTPGTGQVGWRDTFAALHDIGYDGWITVEAFGDRLPALAAATCIWRRTFRDEATLARDAIAFLRSEWAHAAQTERL